MHLRLCLPTAAVLVLLTACAADSSRSSSTTAHLTDADAVRAIGEAMEYDSSARYFAARVDLNEDGRKEFIALVAGPMVCGTGGCPVIVLTPQGSEYRVVSRLSVVQPPVRLSPRSTNGWRNLIVGIGGGGLPAGHAELRFDGASYPLNPTVAPAERTQDVAGSEILIPEFESYLDGKPLARAPAT